MKSRKSYYTTPGVGGGDSGDASKTFNVKVFYVMGKALSGELSCPCDRSCYSLCLKQVSSVYERNSVNPVAFRMAKTLRRFGHLECSRIKD